jgi:O-antigen/teichoic acid export membrane protein
MLKWLTSRVPRGQFARQALTVMLGSSAAQVIAIAASPAMTRIYSPAEFGLFALYSSLVTIAASLSTGRYDVAVLLPKDDEEADRVAMGAMALCAAFSLALWVLSWFFAPRVSRWLDATELSGWLQLAPLAVLLTGVASTLGYGCNRRARYRTLTLSRIAQAALATPAAIGLGLFWSHGGLFVSALLGQFVGVLLLVHAVRPTGIWPGRGTRSGIVTALRKYKKFPVLSIPTDLVSQLAGQLPRFVIGLYFGSTALGLFFLNQRVLDIPLGVVAGSVREVFSQQASKQYQLQGHCLPLFLKTFRHLLLMGLVPAVLVFAFAPSTFALAFGERWREAGEYSQIMVPLYFFRFFVSPLCMMFYIAQKQHQELIWQSVLLVLTVGSLSIGLARNDAKVGLICYSTMYCLMYLVIFFMALRLARGSPAPRPSTEPVTHL